MKIVVTPHAFSRYKVRNCAKEIIEETVIVPFQTVKRLNLSYLSNNKASRMGFFYAFNPKTGWFFVLRKEKDRFTREDVIKVITNFPIEDERKKELIRGAPNWKKFKEVFPFCLVP